MAIPVIMPKQGQSVESCVISEWFKKKGDLVKKGDILFSYETDKASFEEEAQEDGELLEMFYQAGDEVPVLVNVAVIGKKGESVDEFRPGGAPVIELVKTTAKEVQEKQVVKDEVKPVVNDEIMEGKIKISPRAKKLAEKLGVFYANVKGSGPGGRIIERDIEALAASAPRMTSLAAEVAKTESLVPGNDANALGQRVAATDLTASNKIYGVDFEVKPLSNIRKIIAKGMLASLQNSAQLTHHMSADVRRLLDFRNKVKDALAKGGDDNITLNDMVCYAVIRSLVKFPELNAHFLGQEIKTFKKVHLGLAVDTPRGLMVPVLKNADDLSLKGLSKQLKGLADQCRKGTVDPDLLVSIAASFTVSNLGSYGVELFTPVLNLPQVGILGVNTIIPRPADLGNGVFGFVPYIGLSLTYDHRATDGGPATLFLKEIKDQIESFQGEI